MLRLDGPSTGRAKTRKVRIPSGASGLAPGAGPDGGGGGRSSIDFDDSAVTEDAGTGILSNGNVSLFPPGFAENRRAALISKIAKAQTAADHGNDGRRSTEPENWHLAFTHHLRDVEHWAEKGAQNHHKQTLSQDATVSKAIVKAVLSTGLSIPARQMLKAVLSAALATADEDHPLSLFTWNQTMEKVLVANINAFEWDGGGTQVLFSTAQVRTVYTGLETSFLAVLKYNNQKLNLESWFTQLAVT